MLRKLVQRTQLQATHAVAVLLLLRSHASVSVSAPPEGFPEVRRRAAAELHQNLFYAATPAPAPAPTPAQQQHQQQHLI